MTELGEAVLPREGDHLRLQTATAPFWIVVTGQKAAVLQSVAVKRGSCIKSFAVPGLGFDVNPFQATQKVETVNFKGCAVKFQYDIVTGAVTSAAIDPTQSTKPGCAVARTTPPAARSTAAQDVSHLKLTLNGQPLGTGQFGEGYVSSGTNSCTTRVIGGQGLHAGAAPARELRRRPARSAQPECHGFFWGGQPYPAGPVVRPVSRPGASLHGAWAKFLRRRVALVAVLGEGPAQDLVPAGRDVGVDGRRLGRVLLHDREHQRRKSCRP